MTTIEALGAKAKTASAKLAVCTTQAKNEALIGIAEALVHNKREIIEANSIDMESARKNGMTESMMDRLLLTENRIEAIASGVREVASLEDPVGQVAELNKRPNGLQIGRKTVPLGVIAIIYESRPNVTVDAGVLCLKAGNAVILRGGKEAFNSNLAFVKIMRQAVKEAGLPEDSVSIVEDTTRGSVDELMNLSGYVDVLIPRGGAGLISHVVSNSRVPVIETGVGNCHVYVEESADYEMAAEIIYNAKCRRPSVCNAAETLLVDSAIAYDFLPKAKELLDKKDTQIRGCPKTAEILGKCVVTATEEDYYAEFLDYILAVKVVSGLEEAIEHIGKYGTGHSEAIITGDYAAAQRFLDEVDAAAVYVNASTAFTDGGEFGLGAEIGISTQKMHARGPMGLKQLTSTKFIIYGNGQTRQP